MDRFFAHRGTSFVWNEAKAETNMQKHGISFEEAAEVFFDPFYQTGDASVADEERDFVIGYSLAQRLLLAVYVIRLQRTRIISARPATRMERKLYEAA